MMNKRNDHNDGSYYGEHDALAALAFIGGFLLLMVLGFVTKG